MESRVAIIGAGSFGQALGFVLQRRPRVTVEFWDKDPQKVSGQRELAGVVGTAQTVLVCVPSWALRNVLESIRNHVVPDTVVVASVKGLDGGRLTADQLLEVVLLMGQPWALLSGPMLANEIMAGQLSFAVVAAPDRGIFRNVQGLFSGTTVRLEYSSDTRGVALAGVLKNVYAIALGMAQALGLGHNVRGSLTMQACREMARLLPQLGGRAETAVNLAGLADLVATGFSESSRNCRAGKELVETGTCQTVSEGVASLPGLFQLLGGKLESYPVLAATHAVVEKGMPAREAVARLLSVPERQRV